MIRLWVIYIEECLRTITTILALTLRANENYGNLQRGVVINWVNAYNVYRVIKIYAENLVLGDKAFNWGGGFQSGDAARKTSARWEAKTLNIYRDSINEKSLVRKRVFLHLKEKMNILIL